MNPLLLVVASVAVGIDYGYQPLESGGLEYIIQFEPQQLDALNNGMDLISEVPADLDIRRYRIQVGTDKLPRELGSEPHKRGASVDRKGVVKDAVPRTRGETAEDEVASEPVADEFEPKSSDPENVVSKSPAEVDDTEGPALVAEPSGPDKTFSATGRGNPFAAGSFLDRNSPRTLKPAEDADPLPGKSVAAAGFDDREQPRDRSDRDDIGSHRTEKPSLTESSKPRTKAATEPEESEPEKPWMTLVWTIAALCVSLGLNVYLGWIAWTARERYRLVLERTHGEPVEV